MNFSKLKKAGVIDDTSYINKSMSCKDLVKFTQVFEICPTLLSASDVLECFRIANSESGEEIELNFNEFVKAVGWLGIKAYSSSEAFSIEYPTQYAKVK